MGERLGSLLTGHEGEQDATLKINAKGLHMVLFLHYLHILALCWESLQARVNVTGFAPSRTQLLVHSFQHQTSPNSWSKPKPTVTSRESNKQCCLYTCLEPQIKCSQTCFSLENVKVRAISETCCPVANIARKSNLPI